MGADDCQVTVIGKGGNIIPTIHVKDLVNVIVNLAASPPETPYVVAVDKSKTSQKALLFSIVSAVGNGDLATVDKEDESVLLDEAGNSEQLLVDLQFEGGTVAELEDFEWVCWIPCHGDHHAPLPPFPRLISLKATPSTHTKQTQTMQTHTKRTH